MTKHVAVLLGGLSAEREVSLSTGTACANALEGEGYRVTRIDVGRDVAQVLAQVKPDVVFNALHGRFGEDGIVQGILEMMQIPYTHSGVLASALAMQKDRAKAVMAAAGVPVPRGLTVHRLEAAQKHVMEPPYVVKPVNEGSSVGVIIVREDRSHPPQELGREDWAFGDMMLVENYVAGRELTCAVMGDTPLGVIDIVPAEGVFYDYDAKYRKGVDSCPPRGNFTEYLPTRSTVGVNGASISRLQGRQSCRLSIRRPPGRYGRPRLPRSQHAARNDRDIAWCLSWRPMRA